MVGYCLGGKLAYLAGCRLSEVACAVGYYGVGIEKTLDELANVKGRLVYILQNWTNLHRQMRDKRLSMQLTNIQMYKLMFTKVLIMPLHDQKATITTNLQHALLTSVQ